MKKLTVEQMYQLNLIAQMQSKGVLGRMEETGADEIATVDELEQSAYKVALMKLAYEMGYNAAIEE